MSTIADTETFNLVIPRKRNSEVLLQQAGGNYSLPQVEIPTQRRVAEFLTKKVKEQWSLEAVCLFDLASENEASLGGHLNYQVLEPRVSEWIPPTPLRWMKRSSISAQTLTSVGQFQALERSLQLADGHNSGTRRGPFAKSGWMDDLMAWMQARLKPLGLTPTGSFRQLNASPFFNLTRFETNEMPVWFKAVGEPNLHEYLITTALAEQYSKYLPRVIAARPEWHGWLMAEVEGTNLRDTADLDRWRMAVSTLASLQVGLIGKTKWLQQIGCKDRRISQSLSEIEPFLELMVDVMLRQPKTPPPILTRDDLLQLGEKLRDACCHVQKLDLPDSLVHGDFNLGNIWVSSDECVFIDWAEGYVGPPFVTFEYLLGYLDRKDGERSEWKNALYEAYTERWKTVLSPKQISGVKSLGPLIAVLSYALAASGWQDPKRASEPNCSKYLRSLVRRMHREVEKLPNLGLRCANV